MHIEPPGLPVVFQIVWPRRILPGSIASQMEGQGLVLNPYEVLGVCHYLRHQDLANRWIANVHIAKLERWYDRSSKNKAVDAAMPDTFSKESQFYGALMEKYATILLGQVSAIYAHRVM